MSPSPDPLRFAALLAYAPRRWNGVDGSVLQRSVMGWVKDARSDILELIAIRAKERETTIFEGVFGPDATLVPIPRSAPRRTKDTLWPGLSLAGALHGQGLGRDVRQLLERTRTVPKAHSSPGVERPTISVLRKSLRWLGGLGSDLERVVLVDDVVTRGTTFLSARDAIREARPGLKVEGFAAIRTTNFEVVEKPLLDPVRGTIGATADGWGDRHP